MEHWSDALRGLNACAEGIEWAATQPDADTAWRTCTRGDWMLWLIGQRRCERETPEHRALAAIACECARLALPHVPPGEMHPLRAIEAAERYARGEAISREELLDAAYTDADAAYAAAAYASAAAADAARASAADADAADAAAYAYAATAAAAAARASTRAQCADIVRRHVPQIPRIG